MAEGIQELRTTWTLRKSNQDKKETWNISMAYGILIIFHSQNDMHDI